MRLHKKQREIAESKARFKVIRAGRKGGKTAFEIENLCYKALAKASDLNLAKTQFPSTRKVLYVAPTQDQARSIVWEPLKTRLAGVGVPNEQQMTLRVKNADEEETIVRVGGYENRENYRGLTDVVHVTFDEVDTYKDFFISWKEIFRHLFIDTAGTADFIGTPKKENPNLRRLEKQAESDAKWATFKFTSKDNPFLPLSEINEIEKEFQSDKTSYKQEILAEYVENAGALFHYNALVDMFTNTVDKSESKYLIVDVADDGMDSTVYTRWEGLEAYSIEKYEKQNTEGIINRIREIAASDRIPFSNIAVDAIGVGAGVASSSLLDGIIGFKSSHQAIKTDVDPVRLPNVHYTQHAPLVSEYKNLRSQCVFELARHVNNHDLAVKTEDVRIKEQIIEELSLYQDASKGDGKRLATAKEDIKALVGRSPDLTDTLIMRMYFVLLERMLPYQSEERARIYEELDNSFAIAESNSHLNSTR